MPTTATTWTQSPIVDTELNDRIVAYVEQSAATAIYPDEHRLTYPALGLVGELSEVWGAEPTELVSELGDVAWYVAGVWRDAHPGEPGHGGQHLADLVAESAPALVTGVGTLQQALVQSVRDAGVVAEQVKKTVRGRDTVPPPERLALIEQHLAALLVHIATMASAAGATLGEVLEANLAKLAGRAERGVLHGDGDHR